MANHAFRPLAGALDNNLVHLEGVFTITGSTPPVAVASTLSFKGLVPTVLSGSTPLTFNNQNGVKRIATGSWVLVLDQAYPQLKAASFEVFAGAPDLAIKVVGNRDTTTMVSGTTENGLPCGGNVGFWITSGSAGTAFDMTSGSIDIYCSLLLQNSSLKQ